MSSVHARTALVFGGSGQVGAALLRHLREQGWRVWAVSRHPQASDDQLQWLRGEFDAMPALPDAVDAIFSTGPLQKFGQWYADATIRCPRVVAFSSTSVEVKRDSVDRDERALMESLLQGEALVSACARDHGAAVTILRPTLVYGAGRDQSLSRIAAIARRSGFFVLPAHATGRRQPVHVQDLATAALAVIDAPAAGGRTYALPGGETLTYHDMVRRLFAIMRPSPRLITLPSPIFGGLVATAHVFGRLRAMNDAMLARMRADLVFDSEPARRDFGYAPRGFVPDESALP